MKFEQIAEVEKFVDGASGIAWDACHKIYILLDDEQVALMREYGYEEIHTSDELAPIKMSAIVEKWYDLSCGLRFVEAVRTNEDDPNAGFISVIGQFEDEDEEDSW
jgi:hypothetical protein